MLFCADCIGEGKKSRVYHRGTSRTLMSGEGRFWDEDGREHYHDSNTDTDGYECSNGHFWQVKHPTSVCWCQEDV